MTIPNLTFVIVVILVLMISGLPFILSATAEAELAKTVYFAGGCFWGVEHMMSLVPGVMDATSGYANGFVDNPGYHQVISGTTGHRETVKVTYDPNLVTLGELVQLFFSAIDPTMQNRQGNDVGSQYQTGIYYLNENDGVKIQQWAKAEKVKHSAFFVEIAPLTVFFEAEEHHQDYLVKNPDGYCHLGQENFEQAKLTGKLRIPKTAEYRSIAPKDAKAAMDAGKNILFVDVREPFEFAAGHIPGAINLPLGSLEQLAKDQLPEKEILICLYCRSGSRSHIGVMQLVRAGYTNLFDLGGIINWPYEIDK